MERRLAAILAADVVGYSRLMGADEAGVLAALTAMRTEVLEPLITAHRGRIVKLMGDGVLVEFASVVDAVSCAAEIQEKLAARNRALPEGARLEMRIGVNLGDVIVEDGDIYGDGVNVTARLEAMAEPGGICVSGTVHDHVRGKVDLGFVDLGEQAFKNIEAPVRAFRVVPDGAAAPAAPPARPARPPAVRRLRLALGVTLIALALVAGWALWQQPREPRVEPASMDSMAFPLPDKPSIAVLPFADLSEGADQAFLADGLTEDLITDLSKVSGLFVIARNSTFAYKGRQVRIKDVAEELGVRYVLEGSVRSSGDTVRVNAQLIDAMTGGHVWADRFDGRMSDSFAVEDRFVLRIVGALELKLTEAERIEIARVDTRTLDAREAFQRGWELYSRFNAQDNARAAEHFQRAVELDPDYGRAYGALALVYLRGAVFHDWDLALGESDARLYREVVPRYLTEAVRHETALAHVVRAMQHLNYRDQARPEGTNRGTDDARREAGEAIALQPSDPEAHITMAWALIAAGKPQEGLSFVGAAMRLNPASPSHYVLFEAAAHYGLGDLKAAAEALGRGLARDPLAAELMPMAASVRAHLGERSEARRTVEAWRPGLAQDAREALAESYFFPIQWVGAHAGLNLRLIDGLRLAMLPEAVTVESLLTALETGADGERRFRVIRRIGWFGPMAAPAVPVLVAILGDAPRLERKEATIALGKIGPAAAEAVPLLEASLDEPIVGYHAREALKRIQAAVAE